MRYLVGVIVLAVSLAISAYGSGAQAQTSSGWAGFYVGIDGGWGEADFDHDFQIDGHYNFAPGDKFDYDEDDGVLGAHAGYNWQKGKWVYGIEAGFTKTWFETEETSPFIPATDTFESEVEWIASITPRVGYAVAKNTLVYVKGGLAFGRVRDRIEDGLDFVEEEDTRDGWTAGGGVSYMWGQGWHRVHQRNTFEKDR